MASIAQKPAPPTDDKRWKLIDATMRRNGYERSALIETLHTAQDSFGFLDESVLRYVAASLRVSLSAVYGVSTFYHHFSLKPAGEHTCVVCTGTACFIKGTPQLLTHLRQKHQLRDQQTTQDGKVSLLTARCLGACSMAPAVVFDGRIQGEVTQVHLDAHIDDWRKS